MRKKTKHNFVFILIFLLGFGMVMYPVISRLYYRVDSINQVKKFGKAVKGLPKEELDKRLALAKGCNDSLSNVVSKDPYGRKNQEEGRKAYTRILKVKKKIGHVEIPRTNQDLPMYADTNGDVLQIRIGHLEGISLPIGGNSTHAVLTAHNGLPTAKLFTDLKMMKIGGKFYAYNIFGTLTYQVDQIKIMEPSNFSNLLIVERHDYCTLLICTPIMINSHRLLVRGHRVSYAPAVDEVLVANNKASYIYKYLFYVSLVIIAILLYLIYRQRKAKKKLKELDVEDKHEEV